MYNIILISVIAASIVMGIMGFIILPILAKKQERENKYWSYKEEK